MPKTYFLYDDGQFDYSPLIEPASQSAMLGYKAVAWNTGLGQTGWWQGRNVIGMTTNDLLFDINNEISQTVQIQETHNPYEDMPWAWEPNQGVNDTIGISADVAMPVSWGNNLRQANFLLRYEDVSTGQRLWIQPVFFDSQNVNRPMDIFYDPYTGYQDIVVSVQMRGVSPYFTFTGEIQQNAYNDLVHYEVTQTRQQFGDLLNHIEGALGVDVQNEPGYWSLIQEGITAEMASFAVEKWGIGDHGAQQMAVMNLEVRDG